VPEVEGVADEAHRRAWRQLPPRAELGWRELRNLGGAWTAEPQQLLGAGQTPAGPVAEVTVQVGPVGRELETGRLGSAGDGLDLVGQQERVVGREVGDVRGKHGINLAKSGSNLILKSSYWGLIVQFCAI
jgi:hypothetical protein